MVMVSFILFPGIANAGWTDGAYLYGAVGQAQNEYPKDKSDAALGTTGSRNDKTDAYQVGVGYQFNNDWMIEAGAASLGSLGYSATGIDLAGKATAKRLAGIRVWDISDSTSRGFSVLAKLGIAATKTSIEATGALATNPYVTSLARTKKGIYFGLGFKLETSKNWAVRLDADSFDTGVPDINRSTVISIGMNYKFN